MDKFEINGFFEESKIVNKKWEKAEAQRSYIGTVYERVRNAIMELEA